METEKTYIWAIMVIMCVFMLCATLYALAQIKYTVRFETDNSTLAVMKMLPIDQMMNQSMKFTCNQYSDPYYSCPHNLQFIDKDGLYCNSTMVCRNE